MFGGLRRLAITLRYLSFVDSNFSDQLRSVIIVAYIFDLSLAFAIQSVSGAEEDSYNHRKDRRARGVRGFGERIGFFSPSIKEKLFLFGQ